MADQTEFVTSTASQRLRALDALRGFDMFWIVGAEDIVHSLDKVSHTGFAHFLAGQLTHQDWEGVAFYDLIFPLFVFIVGVSLVFSLTKIVEQSGRAAALRRIFWRSALLYLIGLFYYGGFAGGFERIRLLGVLQRIALCYFFAGIAFCTFKLRGLIATCAALLVGYWALMSFVPIRDISLEKKNLERLAVQAGTTNAIVLYRNTTNWVTGKFDEGRNLANHIDLQYLLWRKWDGAYDPEGLLSTLPAIATCLLGAFAGLFMRKRDVPERKKVAWLLGAGAGGVAIGFLWGLQFPVVKKIWTSSYVLVAGGYSCVFLAVFYQIIEIWKFQKWALPFVWIGMNPITIYLVHNMVDLNALANRLIGGPIKASFGAYAEMVVTVVILGFSILIVRLLYRRKIFLRL
ncbi:MAG TPA: heparan-alpha-glucosaminide N-acetyltransferase domain-containing protein [Verrucomicrobiae bacterium]|nr:heparan-alpha-glucosaminide N-acetyltransferase domain-containing protein [Verrucomicrobiae bacterium]